MEGLFGGLLFLGGLSAAGTFVLGCFVGSKIQRTIGYVIKTKAEKELLDQAREREEQSYETRRLEGADERWSEAGVDAVDFLAKRKATGHAHPLPMPPSPAEMPKAKSEDWLDRLGTNRARG